MTERQSTRLALGATLVGLALLASPHARALGTEAGTVISNTATVNFQDVNGNPLSEVSNTVTTTVSTVGAVSINPATASSNADPGDLACYVFPFHGVLLLNGRDAVHYRGVR